MFGALRDMDRAGSQPAGLETLMPPRHVLELFVTVTDMYGYRRDVVISDPHVIHDRAHRHVLTFRHGDGDDHFDEAHNGALAFSARTTMSFPGAFPPVSLATFQKAVKDEAGDLSRVLPGLFRIYQLSHADPSATFFIDGGVLDNRPFGHAIGAIKRRAAQSEVDRKLLYLEPDPGDGGGPPSGKAPNPLATVLASISGLPRKEPVLDDILNVNRHNDRVRRIRDVIESSFDPIARRVEEIVGGDLGKLAASETPAELAAWSDRINDEAKAAAGFAYATYLRSKVSGVVDSFARTICRLSDFPEDCNQAAFVRAVLRSWAESRLYEDQAGRRVLVADQIAFLRTFDLEYGARRLRFVIDALSWWYRDVGKPGYPDRAELNEGKRVLYEARDLLLGALDGRNLHTDLTDEVLAVFAQGPLDDWVNERGLSPDEYAVEHAAELARLEREFGAALNARLAGFGESLYRQLHELTRAWAPQRRADILARFLGFPFWDVLLYPIQIVSDAGERDAIEVVRMSPRDARLLPPLDPGKAKLSGVGTMHFGAFFSRPGRERDYLWGRLDAAERLIGLLFAGGDSEGDDRAAWTRRAFAAIIEEEDAALANARPLLDHVRRLAAS
jgi:patatin-related protein